MLNLQKKYPGINTGVLIPGYRGGFGGILSKLWIGVGVFNMQGRGRVGVLKIQ